MRRTPTALIGLGLLTLAACSGSADPSAPPPAPPPSSPTATSTAPTPSSSPTPTLPAMPEAAKAHTKAGAKAFVKYFWDVVNYAQATGDTAAITPTILPGCHACEAGVASIRRVYDAGGRMRGGDAQLSDVADTLQRQHGRVFADVQYSISVAPLTFDYPGTSRDSQEAANASRDRMRLTATSTSEWRVATFGALQ